MTEKVQKIREKVEMLKSNLVYGACSSQVAMETRCKEEAYNEVLAILDTMQEEPVSEDLVEYINELSKWFPEVSFAKLSRIAVRVAKWQKQQMIKDAVDAECDVILLEEGDELQYSVLYPKGKKPFNKGDKVKLIIIKEG